MNLSLAWTINHRTWTIYQTSKVEGWSSRNYYIKSSWAGTPSTSLRLPNKIENNAISSSRFIWSPLIDWDWTRRFVLDKLPWARKVSSLPIRLQRDREWSLQVRVRHLELQKFDKVNNKNTNNNISPMAGWDWTSRLGQKISRWMKMIIIRKTGPRTLCFTMIFKLWLINVLGKVTQLKQSRGSKLWCPDYTRTTMTTSPLDPRGQNSRRTWWWWMRRNWTGRGVIQARRAETDQSHETP